MTCKNELSDINYWVPDSDHWISVNKEKLKERKELWRIVNLTLKKFFKVEASDQDYLNLHKELFFKGVLPEEYLAKMKKHLFLNGGGEFRYNFFYFYIWYHPDLTEVKLKGCIEKLLYNSEDVTSSINGLLNLHLKVSDFLGPCSSLGLMGGNEKVLVKNLLLYKISDDKCLIDSLPYNLIFRLMTKSSSFLKGVNKDGKYSGNPHDPVIHLWAEASRAVVSAKPDMNSNPHKYKPRLLFRTPIKSILSPSDDLPDWILDICKKLEQQWRNGEFEPWLSQLFERTDKALKEKN